MKKKILALLLTLIFTLTLFPTTAHAATYIFNDMYQYATINFDSFGIVDGDTIIITSDAQYIKLQGNSSTTYNNVVISIESSGNTKFIIENLNIAGSTDTTPIVVHGTNNEMEVRGTCNLTCQYSTGIQVESGDELTIKGSGTLVVKGATNGSDPHGDAAIGGRYEQACGTVNIVDCNVTAIGGRMAAGIGGGGGHYDINMSPPYNLINYPGGNGGTVNISGNAVVYAEGKAADIGGGYVNNNHGALNISGNAAVFFKQSQDALVSGFNYSSGHYYRNSSNKFGYTVGGTPASSITTHISPTINSATYDSSAGILEVSCERLANGDTIDVSKLTLEGKGGSYTLTSPDVSASSTSFTVNLNSNDKLNAANALDKEGTASSDGTTYNLSAATNWNASQSADSDLTGNGITVSNVPTPKINSATYDADGGSLSVSCEGLTAYDIIAVNKLTLEGEGGKYTLTTSNISPTSATNFTVALNSQDKLALSGVLDNSGSFSSSGTTYNLEAATNWNATKGASSDLINNSIDVSNVRVPTISSAVYNSYNNEFTVTGLNIVKRLGSSNDIDISKLTITGEGGSYTITSSSDVEILSSTSFKFKVTLADKTMVDALLDKIGTESSGGTVYNIGAADDWNGPVTGADTSDSTGNAIEVILFVPTPTPTPTASPTPSPSPTPAPATATPAPTSTPKKYNTSTATTSPSDKPTISPSQEATATSEATATPSSTDIAQDTPTPNETQTPQPITPHKTEKQDDGTTKITIDVSSLPEGTTDVKLPNGETISIEDAVDGMLVITLDEDDLNAYGSVDIQAVDDNDMTLASYNIAIPEDVQQGFPLWIFAIAGALIVFWVSYIVAKKKRIEANARNMRR